MYLQITTRCNMTCSHCCFSCTKDGEDMSLETFRAALKPGIDITLGGGEPTLHKHFNTMLLESLAVTRLNVNILDIITNGSITRRALLLASLSKSKLIVAQLSQDRYHDPIDPIVVEAFKGTPLVNSLPTGVRNTTAEKSPSPRGRAITLLSPKPLRGFDCMTLSIFVKPNGDIRQCGCDGSPVIGHVTGDPVDFEPRCCHYAEKPRFF